MTTYIGLEVHIQLNTRTKIFCGCPNAFGAPQNRNICPICLGYPGVLPALNREAMDKAFLTALAFNCAITETTSFARKNYFYPDLPKNYQISQFGAPIGKRGFLELQLAKGLQRINIIEIHLEEDAGKMIHSGDWSLIDYNRSGTPLLEIVTAPDLRSGAEAELLLQQLRQMVRYLGVSDGNMEEGSLRCDANISMGEALPNYKVEIKNINSSRFVRQALEYEARRQMQALEKSVPLQQETRLWNENRDLTEIMRSKEEANDYRYFPEPDLPIFYADDSYLEKIRRAIPELPAARQQRFREQYELEGPIAAQLCTTRELADLFEEVTAEGVEAALAARWLFGDVRKELNHRSLSLIDGPLNAQRLAQILLPLQRGELHIKLAKQLLQALFDERRDPQEIMQDERWRPLRGEKLRAIIQEVLQEYPDIVRNIQEGKRKPLGFLIGQVMKRGEGRCDPQESQELVREMVGISDE